MADPDEFDEPWHNYWPGPEELGMYAVPSRLVVFVREALPPPDYLLVVEDFETGELGYWNYPHD